MLHHFRFTPRLTPQACLSVFLLWERRKAERSHWLNYINSLPPTFSTPPYFTDTELTFLPTTIRQKACAEKQKVLETYAEIHSHCKQSWSHFHQCLDYESYRWAWSVVNTRSVYMDMGLCEFISREEPNNMALAPFLDLLNHSPTANVSFTQYH